MKIRIVFAMLFSCTNVLYAQADMPGAAYAQNIYNPETKSVNLSYNYSGKWDFDGDGKKDSLFFIGNGGAHAYFYPKLILSKDGSTRIYPTVLLDMPYFNNKVQLEKFRKNPAVQLIVDDLDKDGITDIYFNFDHSSGAIPKTWRRKGIHTKYVIVSFAGGTLKCNNY